MPWYTSPSECIKYAAFLYTLLNQHLEVREPCKQCWQTVMWLAPLGCCQHSRLQFNLLLLVCAAMQCMQMNLLGLPSPADARHTRRTELLGHGWMILSPDCCSLLLICICCVLLHGLSDTAPERMLIAANCILDCSFAVWRGSQRPGCERIFWWVQQVTKLAEKTKVRMRTRRNRCATIEISVIYITSSTRSNDHLQRSATACYMTAELELLDLCSSRARCTSLHFSAAKKLPDRQARASRPAPACFCFQPAGARMPG